MIMAPVPARPATVGPVGRHRSPGANGCGCRSGDPPGRVRPTAPRGPDRQSAGQRPADPVRGVRSSTGRTTTTRRRCSRPARSTPRSFHGGGALKAIWSAGGLPRTALTPTLSPGERRPSYGALAHVELCSRRSSTCPTASPATRKCSFDGKKILFSMRRNRGGRLPPLRDQRRRHRPAAAHLRRGHHRHRPALPARRPHRSSPPRASRSTACATGTSWATCSDGGRRGEHPPDRQEHAVRGPRRRCCPTAASSTTAGNTWTATSATPRALWTVNPDGTNHAVYWGNNTASPGRGARRPADPRHASRSSARSPRATTGRGARWRSSTAGSGVDGRAAGRAHLAGRARSTWSSERQLRHVHAASSPSTKTPIRSPTSTSSARA